MKKIFLAALATGMFMLGMAGMANANSINGALWTPANASAQDPGILPLGAATALFTVDNLNFDSRIGTITYDNFLKGSLTTNPNNLVWLSEASGFNKNGFYTSEGKGTFFQFTGTAYFEANTVITHDDGFYMTLGSTIYDYSDPVSPTITSLNNAAGVYKFTMNYGAWNGFPEVLICHTTNHVPEPMTMLLMGTGLAGLIAVRRKMEV